MAQIIIPTPLRKFTGNTASVEVQAGNVQQAIEQLAAQYPDLKNHLLDEQGNIRKFIRLYVGDDDVKQLDNEQTSVSKGTTISIIPAIAGGLGW